jgi:hypothetical protein
MMYAIFIEPVSSYLSHIEASLLTKYMLCTQLYSFELMFNSVKMFLSSPTCNTLTTDAFK